MKDVIVVTGDRDWTSRRTIYSAFRLVSSKMTVVHGDNGYDEQKRRLKDCEPDEIAVYGADKISGAVVKSLGLKVECRPARWKEEGRAAGPKRNRRILDEFHLRIYAVYAFHDRLQESKGTLDMVREAKRRGHEVVLFLSDGRKIVVGKVGGADGDQSLRQ